MIAREQLRQKVISRYRWVCQMYLDLNRYQEGIAAAQRWHALDRLDEESAEVLIKLLAADGQTRQALRRYESLCDKLQEELGVKPGESIERLAEILRRRLSEELTKPVDLDLPTLNEPQLDRPLPDQLADLGRLPKQSVMPYHRNATFEGREKELIELSPTPIAH